jgi:hypothetical protein
MKIKRQMIALSVLIALILPLCVGCGSAKEKTFSASGLEITLNEDFTETNNASMTVCYATTVDVVMALKEEFSRFATAGISAEDMSLDDYAQLVCTSNGISAVVSHDDGLTSFTYQNESNGKNYQYYAVVCKGSDAFWLVQFACEADQFEAHQPSFVQWAKTIKAA